MKSARFMSRDDFNMTGVNEGDLPTPPSNDSKNDPPVDIEAEESSSDFNIIKPCRAENAHLKILVPSVAAGAIIGKNGEAITNIQNSTGAKVKMSKANDFYPGTNERVCLIIGNTDAIMDVYNYISEKVYEKPEAVPRLTSDGRVPYERHKQAKILVPNSTAGMIIGKGGSFIKVIKNKTGAFIQVSQKSKEMNLAERCITVAGELTQTRETMRLLLTKIAEDPQSSSCPNISYVDVAGPVASAYPTGSPYAASGPGPPPTQMHHHTHGAAAAATSCSPSGRCPTFFHPLSTNTATAAGPNGRDARRLTMNGRAGAVGAPPQSLLGAASLPGAGGGGGLWPTSTATHAAPPGAASTTQPPINLDAIRSWVHSLGYSEEAVNEIAHAMHVLNNYGFLSLSSLATWVGFGGRAASATTTTATIPPHHLPPPQHQLHHHHHSHQQMETQLHPTPTSLAQVPLQLPDSALQPSSSPPPPQSSSPSNYSPSSPQQQPPPSEPPLYRSADTASAGSNSSR